MHIDKCTWSVVHRSAITWALVLPEVGQGPSNFRVNFVKSEPNWKSNLRYSRCRWLTFFYCSKCHIIIGEVRKRPNSKLDYWKPLLCCGVVPGDLDINEVIDVLDLDWVIFRYSRARDGHLFVKGYRAPAGARSPVGARKRGTGWIQDFTKGGV